MWHVNSRRAGSQVNRWLKCEGPNDKNISSLPTCRLTFPGKTPRKPTYAWKVRHLRNASVRYVYAKIAALLLSTVGKANIKWKNNTGKGKKIRQTRIQSNVKWNEFVCHNKNIICTKTNSKILNSWPDENVFLEIYFFSNTNYYFFFGKYADRWKLTYINYKL